jgi:hypothetical protein
MSQSIKIIPITWYRQKHDCEFGQGHATDEQDGGTQARVDALNVVFRHWADQGKLAAEMKSETFAVLLTAIIRGIALLARSSDDPDILKNAVDGALQVLQASLNVK